MSALSPDALGEATQRIEGWLLDSGVQLQEGPHRGGVAGWLDREGRPGFVYLEITGYYLTTLAWLIEGAATSEAQATRAGERGRRALEWMAAVTAGEAVPPTRLYLSPVGDDWRNAATFSFDLAMAARGAACFAGDGADGLLRDLGARLQEVSAGSERLRSHAPLDDTEPPDRWSTRPGPHHVKAAAALLRLPPGALDESLLEACRRTVAHWAAKESWPCPELHPYLYGLEGLLMLEPAAGDETLDVVERLYERLLDHQAQDGSLPAVAGAAPREVRADVLAQALRVGALLRAAGRLQSADWPLRLDGLSEALLRHVRPDGGVEFSAPGDVANAWCAMFAHQALVLHARGRDAAPLAAERLI